MKTQITVETFVHEPIEKIWEYWTKPENIVNWYFASDDYHAPSAANDLRVGGKFSTRMESKDGKEGFDFGGTYTLVDEYQRIDFTIGGGRKVTILFIKQGDGYKITETFETEDIHSIEMQRGGWQAILDNFKKHVEE